MTGGDSTADYGGGSIYIVDDIPGQLNITHCVFYKNAAVGSSKHGGAIYASDNNVLVSLKHTTFIKNSAGHSLILWDLT